MATYNFGTFDPTGWQDVSHPGRRNARSYSKDGLTVDFGGVGYYRGPDGEKQWYEPGALPSGMDQSQFSTGYSIGGSPVQSMDYIKSQYGATGPMLDALAPYVKNHSLLGSYIDQSVYDQIGPQYSNTGGSDFWEQFAVPAMMTAFAGGALGGALPTSGFEGLGTFGNSVAAAGGNVFTGAANTANTASSAVGSGTAPAAPTTGVDMTGFTNPNPMDFSGGSNPFQLTDSLINAGQVVNPSAPLGLSEAMGALPTMNTGAFGSVVDLANSAQNLPASTSVMNGGNVGLLSNQIGGAPLGIVDQITNGIKNLLPSSGGSSAGSSALGAIKDLFAPTSGLNLGNVLGGILQGGLGYLGADKQAEAFQNVYNQQSAIGAPYRDRLNASYSPSFDLMSQPGYGDAFNRMAEISTNSWSPKGNPANSPGILAGVLNDVWSQNYLPALSNYRGQLGQFGGLGLNTAGQASLMGAQTSGGGLNALGYGLNTMFQQPSAADDYYRQAAERMRQQNEQYVKVGGQRYGG